jgi:hypothetical protein
MTYLWASKLTLLQLMLARAITGFAALHLFYHDHQFASIHSIVDILLSEVVYIHTWWYEVRIGVGNDIHRDQ